MMKKYLSVLFALLLTACVEGPPAGTPMDLTFDNMKPLEINAARIEVVDKYVPPMRDPNIEHKFRPTPYAAARKLIEKQLQPVGMENTLRAVIEDASVVREELPTQTGVMDYFHQEPSEKLKAKILVRFELVNPAAPDIVLGHAEVIARRDKTLMESISPAERDRATYGLTSDLMDDLNDGLRSIVLNTFGRKF